MTELLCQRQSFLCVLLFSRFQLKRSDCCDRRFNECTDSPNWALSGGLQAGALLNRRNINDRSSAFYRAASQTSLLPIGIEVAISELSNGVLGRQTLGCWLVCLSDSQSVCLFATFGQKSVSYLRVGSPNAPFSCWFINVTNVSYQLLSGFCSSLCVFIFRIWCNLFHRLFDKNFDQ